MNLLIFFFLFLLASWKGNRAIRELMMWERIDCIVKERVRMSVGRKARQKERQAHGSIGQSKVNGIV